MLVRTDVLGERRLGPLDEGLLSMAEHTDLCLLVRQHGGEVYFEPNAVVTYITTGPLCRSDYAFFLPLERGLERGVHRALSGEVGRKPYRSCDPGAV
jgi:hypothetical protein